MKIIAITVLSSLIASALGYHAGTKSEHQNLQDQIEILRFDLERYTNPSIYRHAQKVARLTGAPLSQVLTGQKAGQ